MMDTDLADVSKKSTITPFTIGDFAESLFSSSVVCLFHPVRLDADGNGIHYSLSSQDYMHT